MKITPTHLRQNINKILDRILQTGESVCIERHGRTFLLSLKEDLPRVRRLSDLPRRDDIIIGDPEDLVHIDWSSEWKP